MEEKDSYIEFETEDGEKVSFLVLEETMLNGASYLLVAQATEDDEIEEAYIMRQVTDDDNQAVYEIVEEETELEAVSSVFAELLEDIELEM